MCQLYIIKLWSRLRACVRNVRARRETPQQHLQSQEEMIYKCVVCVWCRAGATPRRPTLSCVAYAQIYYLPLQHRLKSLKRRGSIVSPMFIVFGVICQQVVTEDL